MVRMTILASGSKGNATVVTGGRTRVLVDAGVSCREILKRMAAAGEDCRTLDAILITHEHNDHVQGLAVLARKLGIPVFFTEATHRAWERSLRPQKRMSYAEWLAARKAEAVERAKDQGPRVEGQNSQGQNSQGQNSQGQNSQGQNSQGQNSQGQNSQGQNSQGQDAEGQGCKAGQARELEHIADTATAPSLAAEDIGAEPPCEEPGKPEPWVLPRVEYFQAGKPFAIGDLQITAFTIPHDAADPVGFVLQSEGVRIGIATDLGYMPANACEQLRRADVVMLESNHDLDMLRDGPYPWSVKQRVLSRVGHLSNAAAAEFLEKRYDGGAAYVVLAHLSESNNLPELAQKAAEWALRDRMTLLGNRLVLARQSEPTEPICL